MMDRSFQRAALVVLGLVLAGGSAAQAAEDITGVYDCVGSLPGGRTYRGKVKIIKNGDTYLLRWQIGREPHVGIGLLHDNTLSSSWATQTGDRVLKGIVVYKVEKDRLVGQWAQFPGNGKILKEILTRQK